MRFGWLVAAAALVCAGSAGAQRYVEFQIAGQAQGTYPSGNLVVPNVFEEIYTTTLDFDLQSSSFLSAPNFNVSYGNGSLSTYFTPYGPNFDISFNVSDIPVSSSLVAVPETGSFSLDINCNQHSCNPANGQVIAFLARFTDVAPAQIGISSSVVQFNPLPEAATWAMMILGVGVVGAGVRRERRRAALA